MAPQVVEMAAGSAAKEFKKESATARLLGSGTQHSSKSAAGEAKTLRFRRNRRARDISSCRHHRQTLNEQ